MFRIAGFQSNRFGEINGINPVEEERGLKITTPVNILASIKINGSARAIAGPVDCSRIFRCRCYAYAVVLDKDCTAVLVALRRNALDVDTLHQPLR